MTTRDELVNGIGGAVCPGQPGGSGPDVGLVCGADGPPPQAGTVNLLGPMFTAWRDQDGVLVVTSAAVTPVTSAQTWKTWVRAAR